MTPTWRSQPGPWQGETDAISWYVDGLHCIMLRGNMGHWCGYVDIPEGHPWFGKSYDHINDKLSSIDVHVHGGLTLFSETADAWRVGFDCAHVGDWVPGMRFDHGVYRTQEWVYAETSRLAAGIYSAQEK